MSGLLPLNPEHLAQLNQESAIASEVIAARGYRSVIQSRDLEEKGFPRGQVRVSKSRPALLIPLWNAAGDPAGFLCRPDEPRWSEGKPIKYENPRGQSMVVDVPPPCRPLLGDPVVPLFITEGVKKADSGASRGLCVVALLGVWNFRQTNELGGRTIVPDFEHFHLSGRRVYLVYDSDVMTNPKVFRALERLREYLTWRGAHVFLIYLEPGPHGEKVGLDDYFRAGGSVADLMMLATDELRRPKVEAEDPDDQPGDPEDPVKNFEISPAGLYYWQRNERGPTRIHVTRFRAQILADVEIDDGSGEITRQFEVLAKLNGREHTGLLTPEEWRRMDWPQKWLGPDAVVYNPTSTNADRAAVGFVLKSLNGQGKIPRKHMYAHLGWTKIEGAWVYLHGAGGIGPDGARDGVELALPRGLDRYQLTPAANEEELKAAIRASLSFLDVAARAQTWPLLAAVYVAPLATFCPADFCLWIQGTTGARKSTAAALAMNHFGDFPHRTNLFANFRSTGNAVEIQTYYAKDAPLVIDDYAPAPDAKTQAQQDQVAHRLIRGVGDLSGRQRADRSGNLQAEKSCRCLPIVTSELPVPGSQSSEARTLEVEWEREGVRLDLLAAACRKEVRGLYRVAMAGYVQWLARRMDRIILDLPSRIERARNLMPGDHGRVQETAAKLLTGAWLFLQYAEEVGAVTEAEQKELLQECGAVLTAAAGRTGAKQGERRPFVKFREYLNALLDQKLVSVAALDTGDAPETAPGRWGWVHGRNGWEPGRQAEPIGWLDEEAGRLYLLPIPTHRAVVRYAASVDDVFPAPSPRALADALDREGLMVAKNKGRRDYRVTSPDGHKTVWALSAGFLDGDTPDPEEEGPADGDDGRGPDGGAGGPHPDRTAPAGARHADHGEPPDRGSQRKNLDLLEKTANLANLANQPPPDPLSRHVQTPSDDSQNDSQKLSPEGPFANRSDDSQTDSQTVPASATAEGAAPGTSGEGIRTIRKIRSSGDPTPGHAVHVIETAAGLRELLHELEQVPRVGLDLETTGLDPKRDRARLLSLATDRGGAWVIDLFQVPLAAVQGQVFPLLGSRTVHGHNLQFDLGFLWELGFEPGACWDSYLMELLLSAGQPTPKGWHGLAATAGRRGGMALSKEEQRSDWSRPGLSDAQLLYAGRDAAVLLPVADAQAPEIAGAGLSQVATIENRCLPAVVWMGAAGVPFNLAAWLELAEAAEAEERELIGRMNAIAPAAPECLPELWDGWTWTNPDLVKRALSLAGIDVPSTDDSILSLIDHPLVALLREWRSVNKLVTTYGRAWAEHVRDGRIYPHWLQLGRSDRWRRAGRMACEDPTVLNIPRGSKHRGCFQAPEGRTLIKADYSQIELRIAAVVAGEKRLIELYEGGEDVHRRTAASVLGKALDEVTGEERQIFKSANFGLLYGMSAEGLRWYIRTATGIDVGAEEAVRIRNGWFRLYRGFDRWHARTRREKAEETRTRCGRRRLLDEETPDTFRLNSPVQGTGADGLKRSMALLYERRGRAPGAFPVLACHDELVAECDEGRAEQVEAWLTDAMRDGMGPLIAPVPCEIESQVGRSWAG